MTDAASGPPTASVSAVIPCRNYGHFLADAIQSALAQTVPFEQIIVVDDGSTDDTTAVAARFPSVECVTSDHVGQTKIRNLGLRHAVGELVVFLDADDILRPTYLEKCLGALRSSDADFAYTQYQRFGLLGPNVEEFSSFPEWSVAKLKEKNFVTVSALLPTELARRHPFDERIRRAYGDWDFFLTLAEHGYEGVLVDEPLLLYRRHPSSLQWSYSQSEATRAKVKAYLVVKHRRLYGRREAIARATAEARRWLGLAARARARHVLRSSIRSGS